MGHLEALFLAKRCIYPWQGSVPLLLRLKLGRADLHLPDCSRRGAAADGNLSTLGALPVRELQSREIIRRRGTSELQFFLFFFDHQCWTWNEPQCDLWIEGCCYGCAPELLFFFPNQNSNSFSEDHLCCRFLKWSWLCFSTADTIIYLQQRALNCTS